MSGAGEEAIVFDCHGESLVGILHRAANPGERVGVLIVVGGPQYRVGSHRQFTLMARALAERGYPVLRFDYRGMGDSEGEGRSFEEVHDDLKDAVSAFRVSVPDLRGIILWGLCDAASAIMMNSHQFQDVAGLVLVNPWARTLKSESKAFVRHYYLQRVLQRDFWEKVFAGNLDAGRSVWQFAATLRKSISRGPRGSVHSEASYIDRMLRGLLAFGGPVLLVLSGRDLTAKEFELLRECSEEWNRALAATRVSCVRLDQADHTFSDRSALQDGSAATIDWIRTLQEESR